MQNNVGTHSSPQMFWPRPLFSWGCAQGLGWSDALGEQHTATGGQAFLLLTQPSLDSQLPWKRCPLTEPHSCPIPRTSLHRHLAVITAPHKGPPSGGHHCYDLSLTSHLLSGWWDLHWGELCISDWNSPVDSFPAWSPPGEGNSAYPTIPHKRDPWVYLGDNVLLGSVTLATGQAGVSNQMSVKKCYFFLIICLSPASMPYRELGGGTEEPWLIKISKLKQSYLLSACFEVSTKYINITHKNFTLCVYINQHPMELALLRTLMNHRLKNKKRATWWARNWSWHCLSKWGLSQV